MSRSKTAISIAVGSALAATLGLSPLVSAADSPFGLQSLDKGYSATDDHQYDKEKGGEGKCGEGKCGEGKCGGGKKHTE